MLKLGLAFLFAAFFACNFYENAQAEEPEKPQGDVVLERGGGSREASEKDDGGFAVEDDSVHGYDEHPREDSGKEDERSPGVRKRRYTARCGGKPYNPRWYICCAGVLQSKPLGSASCCGTNAYDSRWRICCAGVLQSKPLGSASCCGTNAYDSRWRICCAGVPQSKPLGSASCCGTNAYDSRWRICCAGVLQSKPLGSASCCGTKAYDARWYKCCQGQVQWRC